MASVEFPGTEFVDGEATKETQGIIMPRHALLIREFQVLDPTESGSLLDEAEEYAESVGWRFVDVNPWVRHAEKTLGPGVAYLIIRVREDPTGLRNEFGIQMGYDRG